MAFFIIENADNYSLVHSLFWHDYGTVEDFVSAEEEYYSYTSCKTGRWIVLIKKLILLHNRTAATST